MADILQISDDLFLCSLSVSQPVTLSFFIPILCKSRIFELHRTAFLLAISLVHNIRYVLCQAKELWKHAGVLSSIHVNLHLNLTSLQCGIIIIFDLTNVFSLYNLRQLWIKTRIKLNFIIDNFEFDFWFVKFHRISMKFNKVLSCAILILIIKFL